MMRDELAVVQIKKFATQRSSRTPCERLSVPVLLL
jgi:hypothetical protein